MNVKPGWTTTEFKCVLLFAGVLLFNMSGYAERPLDWEELLVIAGLLGLYSGGRAAEKVIAARNGVQHPSDADLLIKELRARMNEPSPPPTVNTENRS